MSSVTEREADVDRTEQQLRLIQAVYRVETVSHGAADLGQLRARCVALLDATAAATVGNRRLEELLAEVRVQVSEP